MKEVKMILVAVVLAVLALAPVGQAATVIMDATHYNGSFIDGPIGYEVGYWASDPLSIPTGWVEAATAMYTAADGDNHWAQCGSTAMAVNNTGVLVQVGQAYTVSADLGGGAGTLARVRVWATQFSDGTGWKLCLAEANRPGQAGDSYTLFHVDGTPGFAATSYVSGYYIQVSIGGGVGGYYDNIIVTSAPATITTTTYMTPDFHNGGFNGATTAGFWYNTPTSIPTGWVDSAYPVTGSTNYTTATRFIIPGSYAQAVHNTGQIVHAGQSFTVRADLGYSGANPTVEVLATQNADGTGTKFLLADVNRVVPAGSGYTLFTTKGTPGLAATPRVEGYYIQVRVATYGYFDNIYVTSVAAPITTYTYMQTVKSYISALNNHDVVFNNGYMLAATVGYWIDEDLYGNHPAVAYGWSTVDPNTDPCYVHTVAGGGGNYSFPIFDSRVNGVINNTGEIVPAGHQFKIQADFGGIIGCTAQAFVYATQNADGTGTKVLLAQVSRPGDDATLPSATNIKLYTVKGESGPATDASVAGYRVQVLLKTVGDVNQWGYYKRIIVTSDPVPPADCITVATVGQTVYDMWVSVGKPNCWCYAWQCKGDADGLTEGSAKTGGVYHVGANDLNVLTSGWKKLDTDPAFAANICADFDHQTEGSAKTGGVYHVGANDLNILIANWKSTTVAGDCGGTLVP